jgi:protein-disulfide isomerase
MMTHMKHFILFALATAGFSAPAPATLAQAAPVAAKVDWTKTVVATPDGGYAMGNPRAPLAVVEYGSYTCSHCAHFSAEGLPKLMPYVASGKVRYEFRSFLRNSLDMVVSMVTYCQPAPRFFRMTDMMFARVQDWGKGFSAITPAEQKAWEGKPLGTILPEVSAKGGFTSFMQQRGLPVATTNACLGSPATLAKLQASQKVAYEKYTVQATPTFLLNGAVLDGVSSWETLEPRLKAGK